MCCAWSNGGVRKAISIAGTCGQAGTLLAGAISRCLEGGCQGIPPVHHTHGQPVHPLTDGIGTIAKLMRCCADNPSVQVNGCLAFMALVRGEGELCTAHQWFVAKVGRRHEVPAHTVSYCHFEGYHIRCTQPYFHTVCLT